jgi:hypothetical protein
MSEIKTIVTMTDFSKLIEELMSPHISFARRPRYRVNTVKQTESGNDFNVFVTFTALVKDDREESDEPYLIELTNATGEYRDNGRPTDTKAGRDLAEELVNKFVKNMRVRSVEPAEGKIEIF